MQKPFYGQPAPVNNCNNVYIFSQGTLIKRSKWHTLYLYLNLTLFIVFYVFIRQFSLLNDTKQLLANEFKKREIFLTNGSFKDGIEMQMNGLLQLKYTNVNRVCLPIDFSSSRDWQFVRQPNQLGPEAHRLSASRCCPRASSASF